MHQNAIAEAETAEAKHEVALNPFANDEIIFDHFADNEDSFSSATGVDANDEFHQDFLLAIKVAREMEKKGAVFAYDAMCKSIGRQLIHQAMRFGELVSVDQEHHVLNGKPA